MNRTHVLWGGRGVVLHDPTQELAQVRAKQLLVINYGANRALTEQVMEDGGWISALQEEGRRRDVVFMGRSNLCQEAAFERQGKLRTN